MDFGENLQLSQIYAPDDIDHIIEQIKPLIKWKNLRQIKYADIPCAFDIETSSFFRSTGTEEREKVAIMYEWTMGLNGFVIVGRTWEQFSTVVEKIVEKLELNEKKRLILYVHNLAFEFSFLAKRFTWQNVFAIDSRKPIYANTEHGVEFRCSYLLSGYSLEKLGDELQTYKVKKLVGSLDYDKIRHQQSPMTEEEIAYCVNDVKVVMAYIKERMEEDGGINRLPLTKTGYVRNYCRNSCFYEPGKRRKGSYKKLRYMEMMKSLTLDMDEYEQLRRAFQGGFTHANPFYSGKVVSDVVSYDFTSSYPAVMLSERFPMSSCEIIAPRTEDEFRENLELYCCLFDVRFLGLQTKLWQDSYLSISRCWNVKKPLINNGRVVSADELCTTITEQDFYIIEQFYEWDDMEIGTFRRYCRGYLPTDFVKAILKLYQDKTTLKGVAGKEVEYLRSKEQLNSAYGMAVTAVVREQHPFTNRWLEPEEIGEPDTEKEIKKYNRNSSRFLFYPWGVW